MSYALVPLDRYHPVVRIPRGARLVRPRWAAAGFGASAPGALGTIGISAGDKFYWSVDGWYFVYAWAPVIGWDSGVWVLGSGLCAAAKARTWHVGNSVMWNASGSSAMAVWWAVWSDALKRFTYFAPVDEGLVCSDDQWAYNAGHGPGEVVS